MENEQEQEQQEEEKKYVKFWTHTTVAASEIKRKGTTRDCWHCGKPYTDNIDPIVDRVLCPICLMGFAEGIYKPKKISKRKRIFLNISKIDEKIKNRIS
jgi:hypothetical protein